MKYLMIFSLTFSSYFQSKVNGTLKIFPFEIKEFSLFNSNKKQRDGKMIKPSGKKKYGGNKSEVKSPKIK